MGEDRLFDLYSFLHGQGFELFTLPRGRNTPPPAGFTEPDWKGVTPAQARREAPRGLNIACKVPKGAAVVDTDGPESEAALRLLGLTPTLTIRTPRGRHRYYVTDDLDQTQTKGDGIDIRAQGKGYVLLPPSVVDEPVYRTKAPPPGDPPWGYSLPADGAFVLLRLSEREAKAISRLTRPQRAQKRTGRARGPKRVREARAAGKSAHDEARAGIWKHVRYGRAWTESIREEYVAALMEGGERDEKTARDEIDRLYEGAVKKDEDLPSAAFPLEELPKSLPDADWLDLIQAAKDGEPPPRGRAPKPYADGEPASWPSSGEMPPRMGQFRNQLEAAHVFALADPAAKEGRVRLLLSRKGYRRFQGSHLVEWTEEGGWTPSQAPLGRLSAQGSENLVTLDTSKDKPAWRHLWKEGGSAGWPLGVVKAFAGIEGLACYEDEFDWDRGLLGVPNGVLDVAAGAMRADPDAMVLRRTAVTPRPYEGGRLQELVARAFPSEAVRRLFELEMGLCAWGRTLTKRVLMLLGPPNAGKSSLMLAFAAAFGDYAGKLPAAALVRTRGSGSFSTESGIAALAGARWGLVGDLPGGDGNAPHWDAATLIELTGGEGAEGRRIGQDAIRIWLRVIACMNVLPVLPADLALRRAVVARCLPLPFANMALCNADLHFLHSEEALGEALGLVREAAPIAIRLPQNLPLPEACVQILTDYVTDEE